MKILLAGYLLISSSRPGSQVSILQGDESQE
ncbi:hypothetical protein V6Z11_A12G023500 [Gossypium hirsutum]